MSVRFLDAGDAAVVVEFGDRVDPALVAQVGALEQAVEAARARGELPGVIETMPTFRSLTVMYDPLATRRADIDAVLRRLLDSAGGPAAAVGRRWRLPVCYDPRFGLDLADIAAATGLAPQDVAAMHAASEFTVYMIGFMPGFPFMGGLPARLGMPRRREPRVRVPVGSVAITGGLTGIYPWESPGGWQIVGRCPVRLFDATRSTPSLLTPGDRVVFEAVSLARFGEVLDAVAAGELDPSAWLEPAP